MSITDEWKVTVCWITTIISVNRNAYIAIAVFYPNWLQKIFKEVAFENILHRSTHIWRRLRTAVYKLHVKYATLTTQKYLPHAVDIIKCRVS